MPGTVVMLHNPFRPERDREVITVTEPLSIHDWLDERGIDEFECPTICLRNGSPLLRGRWDDTEIGENDLVVFVPLPQGGGGGGDKNPLRTILMLAVMVAAAYFAPMLGPALGEALGVSAAIGTSLAQAGIALVGTALVNVLIPPPKPSALTANFGSAPAPSPTYSLQAQGNHARLAQPIPVVYGRHRVFPDLAATPWAEYSDNDQYLHQLHCIGARRGSSTSSLPAGYRSGTRILAGRSRNPPAPSPGPSPTLPGHATAPGSTTPASISRRSMPSMRSGNRAATASMPCSIRASRSGRRLPGSPAAAGRCRSCRAASCGSSATRRAPCRWRCSDPATSSGAASESSTSCRAEDTADAVTVTYFSERTWAPGEVVAALPDSDTEATDKPATVELVRLHRPGTSDARGSLYGCRQPLPPAHYDLPPPSSKG